MIDTPACQRCLILGFECDRCKDQRFNQIKHALRTGQVALDTGMSKARMPEETYEDYHKRLKLLKVAVQRESRGVYTVIHRKKKDDRSKRKS